MLTYKPTPTGQKFLASRAFIKGIVGPVGAGKSTAALMDLLQRAVQQEPYQGVRYSKMGILRNTIAQLNDTVKPMMDTWLIKLTGGRLGAWKTSSRTFEMRFALADGTVVESDFMLIAADTPDDVRRLLSLELTAGWVEEAREIDDKVFDGFTGRVNRYPPTSAMVPPTYPGVTFSTNQPAIGTFWHGMIATPPEGVEVFVQPPALLDDGSLNPDAENLENLAPMYYENLISGKTDEWIDVYLKNKFGIGNAGRPVFGRAFKRSFHMAEKPLELVVQGSDVVVGMDNGLTAAAVPMQRDAWGRVNVLGECYVPKDQTMGVETFLDRLLVPYLRERFAGAPHSKYLFVLDPACFQRSQVDEKTIAQAVRQRGFRAIAAPTNDPERRVQAVESLLALQIDGGPGLRIDPRCTFLAEGLEWGYRFKKGGMGFEKNHHSHETEAFTYACLYMGSPSSQSSWDPRPQRREVVPRGYVYARPGARRAPDAAVAGEMTWPQ